MTEQGNRTVPPWNWVLPFVICPICRQPLVLELVSDDGRDGVLAHAAGTCREAYPVIDGVLRLMPAEARGALAEAHAEWFASSPYAPRFAAWKSRRSDTEQLGIVARFDDEWRAFSQVGTTEQDRIFSQYFDIAPPELLTTGHVALDAGCGGGRWAFAVQARGTRVIAMDLGRSVEVAERNTRHTGRVACVQADLRELPVRAGALDFAYSLGVLHHLGPTERAVQLLARTLRPGGALLIYLYYALDGRSSAYQLLYRGVDGVRRVTSRLPQSLLVAVTTAIAALVYYPLARLARLLRRMRLRRLSAAVPLSFYADLSFATMRNDSLDRFGTTLEKRYTRDAVQQMLNAAELRDIVVSAGPPYWHAVGRAMDAVDSH